MKASQPSSKRESRDLTTEFCTSRLADWLGQWVRDLAARRSVDCSRNAASYSKEGVRMNPDLDRVPAGPEQTDIYDVYALRYTWNDRRRIHENFLRRDMLDGPMPIDFYIWILRNQHRTVIVDTGFGRRAEAERGQSLEIDPIEALRIIGIEPDEVEDVVLTHLHYDHAGNIDKFARARFHVQEAEVAYATGSCMGSAAMRYTFDVENVAQIVRLTFAERVVHHCGTAEPFPGISLHLLPGHSEGLQGVRVDTRRGPLLLACDASVYFSNYIRRAPFGITIDVRDTLAAFRSIARLTGSIAHLIPGHDPLIRKLYPSISVAGVELVALHAKPDPARFEELRGG
ncbi:N-acyl homoserine lactonase family protein [Rhodopseudomonas sp. P2A-2r]|uniref:N-acyl homoserine lactonase family protein n=2 Tax=unclassified Rhodopseudomonas TaxID=2638247 RepID=UPI0039B6EA38